MKKLLPFLMITFVLCSCHSPQKKVKKPKKGVTYLVGRYPGKGWIEHNPPKFKALQSFEKYVPDKLVLTLEYLKHYSVAKYKNEIDSKFTILSWDKVEELTSDLGKWSVIHCIGNKFQVLFYFLEKENGLVIVKLIAPDATTMALVKPEVDRYVLELWERKL